MSSNEHHSLAVHCSFRELRVPASLVPHPRNPNRHPVEQIRVLAKVILHQGWRNPIVVSARSGFVIAGHGRLAAAIQLGVDSVPVDVQDFASEADEWAHLVADNRIAELADLEKAALTSLLEDLGDVEGFDLELTGFGEAEADKLLGEDDGSGKIADKPDASEQACLLKFDGVSIPLTEDERSELRQRMDAYADVTGSYFGFVRSLLSVAGEEVGDV